MISDLSDEIPVPPIERMAKQVIGAAIEVHKALGPGYLESVYDAALGIELEFRGIEFASQYPTTVSDYCALQRTFCRRRQSRFSG